MEGQDSPKPNARAFCQALRLSSKAATIGQEGGSGARRAWLGNGRGPTKVAGHGLHVYRRETHGFSPHAILVFTRKAIPAVRHSALIWPTQILNWHFLAAYKHGNSKTVPAREEGRRVRAGVIYAGLIAASRQGRATAYAGKQKICVVGRRHEAKHLRGIIFFKCV